MDKYFNNIKSLIENNLVELKKNEIRNNCHTLITYYNVGKLLVSAQGGKTKNNYGDYLIKNYSIKLTEEFGKGYDSSNLKRMRLLFLCFPNGAPLGHLSWTHYKILLPIKDESKRNYYINSSIEHNFSKRQLEEYIKDDAYERLAQKDNIKLKYIQKSQNIHVNIIDMIKDPILINVNKSVDKITEKALKQFMLEQIEKTMLELGNGFAYMGNEVPIRINNKIFRPDLVFFNVELNSYVIIELKLKDLSIKDISQIEFYVRYYDSDIKKPFHNPTIGITISKRIDKQIFNYTKKENIKNTTYELI